VRVHVGGDFYDADYAEKWLEIGKRFPEVRFLAYTRSWRVPEVREILEEIRKLPNFALYASTDVDTGPPPPGWPEAGIQRTYLHPSVKCTVGMCHVCRYCIYERGHVWWPLR